MNQYILQALDNDEDQFGLYQVSAETENAARLKLLSAFKEYAHTSSMDWFDRFLFQNKEQYSDIQRLFTTNVYLIK